MNYKSMKKLINQAYCQGKDVVIVYIHHFKSSKGEELRASVKEFPNESLKHIIERLEESHDPVTYEGGEVVHAEMLEVIS